MSARRYRHIPPGSYARSIKRLDVIPDPAGQHFLGNFTGCKAEDDGGCLLRGSIEIKPVESQKHDHRCKRGPLVAVNKRMIARDAETISRREIGQFTFAVAKFVDRPASADSNKPRSRMPSAPPKQRKLLGMEVKDDDRIEPFRLVHLASALYVSAYLRKDRRAISIALACFGS